MRRLLAIAIVLLAVAGCSGNGKSEAPAVPSPSPSVPVIDQVIERQDPLLSGPQAEALGGTESLVEGQTVATRVLLDAGVVPSAVFSADVPSEAQAKRLLSYLTPEAAERFLKALRFAQAGDSAAASLVRVLMPFGMAPGSSPFGKGRTFSSYSISMPAASADSSKAPADMLYVVTVEQQVESASLVREVRLRLSPFPAGRTADGRVIHWLIADWQGTSAVSSTRSP